MFSAVEVLPSPNYMTESHVWFGTGGWIAFSLSDWFSCYYCRELRTCSCSELGIGIGIHNDCPAAWICKCYCKSLLFPSHWSYGLWQVQKKDACASEWADVRGMGRWDALYHCCEFTALLPSARPHQRRGTRQALLNTRRSGKIFIHSGRHWMSGSSFLHSLLHRVLKTVHFYHKWMAFID